MNLAEGVINTFVEARIRASERMDGLAAPRYHGRYRDSATASSVAAGDFKPGMRRCKVSQISHVR